ncbi:MAG: PAS domain-containing protein [Pseudomonadota bacterium]
MSDTHLSSADPKDQRRGGLISRLRPRPKPGGGESRKLLHYWNTTRRGFDVPRRSDIDPRGIAGMLSQTFIIEQIAPGLGRFRVAGTHLGDLLGMDVRGMPISAMLRPAARDEMAAGLRNLFDMPGILRAALVSPGEFRRPELEAELLILPLRDDRGEVTRAIGCLIAKGQVGKTPRRFDIRHLRVDPVSVVRAVDEMPTALAQEEEDVALLPAPVADKTRAQVQHTELGEDAGTVPTFAPLKPGQPSYLRLVVSDT